MKLNPATKVALVAACSTALLGLIRAASADPLPTLAITEVDAGGSAGTTGYKGDWFELTNTGAAAIDVNGYGVVDSHVGTETPPSTLSDITIPAGASAVFLDASGGGVSTITNFETAWFGTNVPSDFLIGTYGPSTGIGLSQTGDQVNLFLPDLTTEVYGVTFTADPSGVTLDNSAGAAYTGANIALSTESAVGVNGAFTSASGLEIGSPGTITSAVPEPASLALLALGGIALLKRRRAR